jgi:signal transduction histidine kinase
MPRALPMHLVALAVQAAVTAYALWVLGPALPEARRTLIWAILGALFVAWAAVVTAWRLGRGRARRLTWRRANWIIGWLANAANIAGFWIAMPYADEALVLVLAVFAYANVTVQVLGSIRRPPAPEGWVLTPLALPASITLWALLHWTPHIAPLAPYSAVFVVMMMELRRVAQRAVNRAHVAQAEAEVALVQAAAERDAKTRFLTSASHDLGQPLQAARLSLEQLLRSPDTGQRERAARRLNWALDTTDQLLSQILDHLRLEAGGVEARMTPVALGPLIARLAELSEPAARLAGVAVHALPSRLVALADPTLVERALGNFLANSLRHARGRRVLMGARRRDGRIRLWVIDDGVGISEADAPRLFDDYVQGDHGDEVRGGFGLGLASARRMAGLMNGGVGLDSRWRSGAAFWLELPAA